MEGDLADRPTDGGSFPEDRYTNPEAALGGADAVEKTTYVTGRGTEPETLSDDPGVKAQVPAGGGQGATWAVLALLIIGAVLVYLLGFGR